MYLKYLQNFFDDDDPDDCICNAASLVPKVMSKLKASRIDFYESLSLRKKYLYLELFWSKCGKMQNRITLNTGTFHALYCKLSGRFLV